MSINRKYFSLLFGILFSIFFSISMVFSLGWHTAPEIFPGTSGTFQEGNYTFPDNLNITETLYANDRICLNGACITGWIFAGDIEAIIAGTGLTGGNASGNATLNVNTSYVQQRVSSGCAIGSSIRVIEENGSVTCETDNDEAGAFDGSGTASYITQWSDSDTLTDSIMSGNSDNVTIVGDFLISNSTDGNASGLLYLGKYNGAYQPVIYFDPTKGSEGKFVFGKPIEVPGASPAITFYDISDPTNDSKRYSMVYDADTKSLSTGDAYVVNFAATGGLPQPNKVFFQIGNRTIQSPAGGGTYFGFNTPASFTGDLIKLQKGNTDRFRVTQNGDIIITGGTMTGNAPILNTHQTWNNGAVDFSAWLLNIVNTASGSDSKLLDLQVGGATQFSVDTDGGFKSTGTATVIGDLNVTGVSYLGNFVIDASNISVDGNLVVDGSGNIITNQITSKDGNITFRNTTGSETGRFTENGRLGIGTVNPGSKLHILQEGSTGFIIERDSTHINRFQLSVSGGEGLASNSLKFFSLENAADIGLRGSTSGDAQFILKGATGNVGIGNTTPTSTLSVVGDASIDILKSREFETGGSAGWYELGTFSGAHSGARLVIEILGAQGYSEDFDSDVGRSFIVLSVQNGGATGPNFEGYFWSEGGDAVLDNVKGVEVDAGTIKIFADMNSYSSAGISVKKSRGTWDWNLTAGSDPGPDSSTQQALQNRYVLRTGNVGIGVASPGTKLDVGGVIRTSDQFRAVVGGNDVSLIANHGAFGPGTGSVSNDNFTIFTNNAGRVTVSPSGDVGIGTTNPQQKLVVVGDLNVTGTSYLSDISVSSDNILVNNVTSLDGNISFKNSTGYEKIKLLDNGRVTLVGNGADTTADLVFSSVGTGNAGIGGASGQLRFFTPDGGLGAYLSNANFRINTGQDFIVDDDVGIGTGTPLQALHIKGSNAHTRIDRAGREVWDIGATNSGGTGLQFYNVNDTSVRLIITEAGNVGIGTTSPTAPFEVQFPGDNGIRVESSTSHASLYLDSSTGASGQYVRFSQDGANKYWIMGEPDGDLAFRPAAGTAAVTFNTSGNVGIGTGSPGGKLEIYDASLDADLRFNTNSRIWTIGGKQSDDSFRISSTGLGTGDVITLDTTGNVGIGTNNPNSTLHVDGDINATSGNDICITGGNCLSSVTAGFDGIGSANNVTMFTDSDTLTSSPFYVSSGNVGIGTTTPQERLHFGTNEYILMNDSGIKFYDGFDSQYVGVIEERSGKLTVVPGNTAKPIFAAEDTSLNTKFFISSENNGGFVGLGTNNPQYTLDVHRTTGINDHVAQFKNIGDDDALIYVNATTANETYDFGIVNSDFVIRERSGVTGLILDQEGRVGIGNNSPNALLQVGGGSGIDGEIIVASDAGRQAVLEADDSGNYLHVGSTSAHDFAIVRDDSAHIRLTTGGFTEFPAGNVGIGATSPKQPLHVSGNTLIEGNNVRFIANTTTASSAGSSLRLYDGFNGDSDGVHIRRYLDTFSIDSPFGTSRIYMNTTTGNVGIGTITPGEKLEVVGDINSTGGDICITGGNCLSSVTGTIDGSGSAGNITYFTDSDTLASSTMFQNGGNLGVGTRSAGSRLSILTENNPQPLEIGRQGMNNWTFRVTHGGLGIDANSLIIKPGSTNGVASDFAIKTSTADSGTPDFVVDSSGRVGIGTANPGYNLEINGSNPSFEITNDGLGTGFFVRLSGSDSGSGGGEIDLRRPNIGTTVHISGTANEDSYFNSGGNLGIGTTSPDVPLEIKSSTGGAAVRLVGRSSDSISTLTFANSGETSTNSYVQGNGTYLRARSDGGFHFNIGNTPTVGTNAYTFEGGNVGIGTTQPNSTLHVDGDINVTTGNDICINGGNCLSEVAVSMIDGTGNAGYVAKFSDSNTLADSALFDDGSGSVGIGTETPGADLDVRGSMRVTLTGTGITGGSSSNSAIYDNGTNVDINGTFSVNARPESFVPINATGGTITEVGPYRIHTFTSSGTFEVFSTGSGDAEIEYLVVAGGGAGGAGSATYRGGGGGGGGLLTGSMTLPSNGSYTVTVGAGGSANAGNGGSSVFDSITTTGGGGGGNQQSANGKSGGSGGGGGGGGAACSAGSGTGGQGNAGAPGNCGGYASGTGGGAASNGAGGGLPLISNFTGTPTNYSAGGRSSWSTIHGAANSGQGGSGDAAGLASGNGGSGVVIVRYLIENTLRNAITVDSGANVGIGETNPLYKLHVKGTVCLDLNGDNTCDDTTSSLSDIRIKKNVQTIQDSLEKINKLRGVEFDWRNDEFSELKLGDKHQIGFIAQEVELVLPEIITTGIGDDDLKAVDYDKITALLVEGVQDLHKQINEQDKTINELIARIEALENN